MGIRNPPVARLPNRQYAPHNPSWGFVTFPSGAYTLNNMFS